MIQKALTYDGGKEPLAWLPWAAIDEMSHVQQCYRYQRITEAQTEGEWAQERVNGDPLRPRRAGCYAGHAKGSLGSTS